MQIHLLFRRFEQHQQIVWKKEKGAVQDRTIYEDTIFARMLHEAGFIDKRDYETYLGHFNIMKRFLVYPDILIYLRVSPETSMQRIQERGRDAEGEITLEYMQKLHQGYESFITEMDHYTRTLTLDWNEYMETDEVAKMVKSLASPNISMPFCFSYCCSSIISPSCQYNHRCSNRIEGLFDLIAFLA